jgi:hypothetical protein
MVSVRLKFFPTALVLGLSLALGTNPCLAGRKTKKAARKSYPAIVEDEAPLPKRVISASSRSDREPGEGSPLVTQRQAKEAEKLRAAEAQPATQPPAPPFPNFESVEPLVIGSTERFESVPHEHVESIAGRLKIVEKLITEYGRAYDYRMHTTQELQAILNQLSHAGP